MPATMNASVTDGPERSAIAAAVRTNRPAPMIAPMPSATSAIGPSVRFRLCSPCAALSAMSWSIDFVLVRESDTAFPLSEWVASRQTAGLAAALSTVPDTRAHQRGLSQSDELRRVVRRLARDGDVVRVRLAQARGGDAGELRLGA